MWPVGWEALEQWGDDIVRSEPLTGGVGVNEVWSVRVSGHLAVGRLGQRSDADLAWETADQAGPAGRLRQLVPGWFARKESFIHVRPPDPRQAGRLPAGS